MKYKLLMLVCFVSLGLAAPQTQAPTVIPPADQMQPQALAVTIADSKTASKPLVLYVGFSTLYKSSHIPGSMLAGPAANAAGLDTLKQALEKIPKDREIVIYCGCCPWDKCPNIRPAFDLLKKMGFTKAKALVIESNLDENWVRKGYPVERGN